MIIESIFQGKIPIRRVYLNGDIVWKPPVYLPPYLIYLNTEALGEQALSKVHLEQGYVERVEDPTTNTTLIGSTIHIESGNKFVDNIGQTYIQGGPIGADLFLVDRDVTEEYSPTIIQNVMNALYLEQIKGEYVDGPELFVEKYGLSLDTMVGSRIVSEELSFLGNASGLFARGAVLPHDVLLKVLFESLINGVSSTGRIVEYGVLEKFPINHNATGLGADGQIGDFSALERFFIEHNATGLGANGKLGDFSALEKFLIEHGVTGLGANGKLGDYDHLVRFFMDHNATGLGANGKLGDFSALEKFLIDHGAISLAGKAEFGEVDATLTVNVETDRSAESLDSRRLTARREDSTTCTSDSRLTNFSVPTIDHDDIHNVEYAASVSMPSVSSESVSFTKQEDAYESELNGSKIGVAELNLNEAIEPVVTSSASIQVMFWLFPVQTDTDLYIPQVYDNGVITGAVQNGSELMM